MAETPSTWAASACVIPWTLTRSNASRSPSGKLAIASSNLGDTRTLVIPVAHTIFYEIGPERRAAMGIAESLVRVSVGIEDTADLLEDFKQAL